ncbi:XhlA domain-containing holin-like protein [Bacillus phage vB_BcM_Sam46]|uniref:XhlA domain-containing holin-like protein n=1 Tax=Bacillus phage vB_BcM_Sam46 TaxID=2719179 RepID=A0A6G9L6U6_9CAUD|nr:XhlA domain-containing holin-like protein [Bacillus phage vB_BcM_Sam46]
MDGMNQNAMVTIDKLIDKLDDIKERLIVIETEMKGVNEIKTSVDALEKETTEATQSTRSAHKRLDTLESNITWLWRTVGSGLITLVFGVILFFITQGGK